MGKDNQITEINHTEYSETSNLQQTIFTYSFILVHQSYVVEDTSSFDQFGTHLYFVR